MERKDQHRARCMLSMFKCFVTFLAFPMSAYAQEHPPRVLQTYRDFLKPGSEQDGA
jgi:hypothetical protein